MPLIPNARFLKQFALLFFPKKSWAHLTVHPAITKAVGIA
jgi:hypothetical protein